MSDDPDDQPKHFDWAWEYCSNLMRENGNHPFNLEDPYRAVVLVVEAQSKIGNGGFDYFYGNDYSHDDVTPSYEVFAKAYEEIGAREAAGIFRESLKCFPFSDPHLKMDERLDFIDERRHSGDQLDQLSEAMWRPGLVWKKLYDYIADRFEAFSY